MEGEINSSNNITDQSSSIEILYPPINPASTETEGNNIKEEMNATMPPTQLPPSSTVNSNISTMTTTSTAKSTLKDQLFVYQNNVIESYAPFIVGDGVNTQQESNDIVLLLLQILHRISDNCGTVLVSEQYR